MLVTVVAAGCGGAKGGWGKGGFSMPPMPVETAVATNRTVADRFETVGSLEASDAVNVVSEIDGIVKEIPFVEGGTVQKGDLIAQLDDQELKAELDRVTALRDQSRLNYERVKTVVNQGAAAQQDLDDAAAAQKVAEANVAFARARYDKTRIMAPFDGLMGARRISPGAYVRAGDVITDIAQLHTLRANFSVPERYLPQIKKGSQVDVTVTAFPGYALTGRIGVIEPQLDPGTRSAHVIALVSNPETKFRPGMSANVSAVLGERPEALTISSEAVFMDQNQAFVYVIKPDSTVMREAVQLGTRTSNMVGVASGLQEGDRVVRTGHQKIFEGAKVIPVMSRDSTAAEKPIVQR
jgi:membrane fusion protein (multidrug efflux system)